MLDRANSCESTRTSKQTRAYIWKVKLSGILSPINYVGKSRHFASTTVSGFTPRRLKSRVVSPIGDTQRDVRRLPIAVAD